MLSSGVLSIEEVNQLQEPMSTPSGMSQALRSFDKSFDFEGKNLPCFHNGKQQESSAQAACFPNSFPEFNEVVARAATVKAEKGNVEEAMEKGGSAMNSNLQVLPVAGVLKEVKKVETKKRGRKRRSSTKKPATKRTRKSPSFTEGGRWTKEEDEMLRKAVDSVGAKNWKLISRKYLNGSRSDVQCECTSEV